MATLSKIKIKQGTTPMLTVFIDEAIQDATVYLTIRTGRHNIVKSNYMSEEGLVLEPVYDSNEEQTGTRITAQLTQVETLCLRRGAARIEAEWIFEDGTADKSNIGLFNVTDSLYKKVMEYGKHTS